MKDGGTFLDYFEELERSNKIEKDSLKMEDDKKALNNKQTELLKFFRNPLGIAQIVLSLAVLVIIVMFFLKSIPLFFKVNINGSLLLSLMVYLFAILIYWVISLINVYVFITIFINAIKKNSTKSGKAWGFLKKFTHFVRLIVLIGNLILLIIFTLGISYEYFYLKIFLFLVAYVLVVLSFASIINLENDLSVSYTSLYKQIPKARIVIIINLGLAILFVLFLNYFYNNSTTLLAQLFNENYALNFLYIGEQRVARYFASIDDIKNLVYLSLALLSIKHLYGVLYLLIYNRRFVNTNLYLKQDIKRIETKRENEFF